jgi:threonine dehydratase
MKKLEMTRSAAAPGSVIAVTQSSGNHGQALARAGMECGISVEVVMPSNINPAKIGPIESYGGVVTLRHPSEQVCQWKDLV